MNLDPRFVKWAVQDLGELKSFVEIVRDEKVTSYLEVGAKYGGSFWHVVTAMPKGSLAVAIDLPFGSTFKRPVSEPYLREVVRELVAMGYDAHFILGDSTSKDVIQKAKSRAPYDLCLIDANHTEKYVRSDWENYGPMAGIVAFHDIAFDPRKNHPQKIFPIEVAKVWNEIKGQYHHREIRSNQGKMENGFGILWREI